MLALLMFMRSSLRGSRGAIVAAGLAAAVVVLFWGLDRGVPAYRIYRATSLVRSLSGHISMDEAGIASVDFAGTNLDDDSLRDVVDRLRMLPNVQGLSLARTRVTDRGIPAVRSLTKLKRLDITGTNISTTEKTVLGRSLPDLEILDSNHT
jgi:hypothetical protein